MLRALHTMYVQTQVESSVEKTLCCWLCTSGPISITSRTDRRGYCPGELFPYIIQCCSCCVIRSLETIFEGINLSFSFFGSLKYAW